MTDPDQALFSQVADRFGLSGPGRLIRPLPGERTRNALVEPGGPGGGCAGGRVVLKLHPAADRPDVELEVAALRHLAAAGLAGRVPEPVRAAGGADLLELDTPGGVRLVRALTWLPGRTWSRAAGHTEPAAALLGLGRLVATVDAALAGFDHPHARRPLAWNLVRAPAALDLLAHVGDPARRALATAVLQDFGRDVAPRLAALPAQVIHNDANDANVLLDAEGRVTGLIDFGDLCRAPRVCGLAVALAYAMADLGAGRLAGRPADLLARAVAPLVTGYHEVAPLTAEELALLLPLVRTRLALSVAMAGWQHSRDPGNAYLLVSQDAVWGLLQRLAGPGSLDDRLALCRWRQAVGEEPDPGSAAVRTHLRAASPSPVLGALAAAPHRVLDWSAGSAGAGAADLPAGTVGVGRYAEARAVYATPAFETGDTGPDGEPERRTVHLGIDLFAPPGTGVHAPLDGAVHLLADNAAPLDYGPVVVLRHELPGGAGFFTLYGHLSRNALRELAIGQPVAAGQRFAAIGGQDENGGWPPHVHLQLLSDLLGLGVDVPGVAAVADLPLWTSISPDPDLVLRLGTGGQ